MSSTATIVTAVIVVLIVIAVVAAIMTQRRRSALRKRFGPEYERVIAESPNRRLAERELRDRKQRHDELHLRELDPQQRERYAAQWEQTQSHFVDQPEMAAREADLLVVEVMSQRGYPVDSYEGQVADLSVDHANTVEHYREAHEINLANERGQATTEQLRQALVHYRALFAELLGDGGRQPRHG